MNASDATLWAIERDPLLRSTIVAIAVLDRAPSWSRLRDRFATIVDEIPRLREKVATPPLHLAAPSWVPDPDFDLDYHLRRVVTPPPGDLRAVLDLAGPSYMASFDKDRPLWEFTLVEGLADGRAAFVQKIHHSVTDGVGGVQLADRVLDHTRSQRHPDGHRQDGSGATASPRSRRASAVATPGLHLPRLDNWIVGDVRHAAESTTRLAAGLPGVVADAALHPARVVTDGVRTARSLARLMRPVRAPLSPVMTGRGTARRLDAFDAPTAALRDAASTVDGTLNDAFLAAVTGGLRRYHEHHHRSVDRLRVTMPINVRRTSDEPGGNRFVPARFTLPVAVADPVERMRQLGELARDWRAAPALALTDVVAGALDRLPGGMTAAVLGSMLKAIDVVATNVRGPTGARYLAGAKVLREYAFAPPSGAAFAVALLSMDGACGIGVTVDIVAVPDPDVLGRCLREGFAEVLAVTPCP